MNHNNSLEKYANKKSFMWNPEWVRPYESLWSIIHNFRVVNSYSNYNEVLKLLDLTCPHKIKPHYDFRLGVYSVLSDKLNDYEILNKYILPPNYSKYLRKINKAMKTCSHFVSLQLRYCPVCIKQGYHSILHQLSGLEYCPLHRNSRLTVYLNDSYIFGDTQKYTGDRNQKESYFAMAGRYHDIIRHINFENLNSFSLPIDWEEISELNDFCSSDSIKDDFNKLILKGANINNANCPPNIGIFLLNKYKISPVISIYDSSMDYHEESKWIEELQNLDLQYKQDNLDFIHYRYIDVILHLLILKLLKGYSKEEIRYKCYILQMGEKINIFDELGVRLLYISLLVGCKYLIDSVDVGCIADVLNNNPKYNPITKHNINIRDMHCSNIGNAMIYHIVKLHVEITLKNYLERLRKYSRYHEEIDINFDFGLIDIPAFLVEDKDNIQNLYIFNGRI